MGGEGGTEEEAPPKERGESRLTLSPLRSAQTMSRFAMREDGGGW